jgi:hypothetical protein
MNDLKKLTRIPQWKFLLFYQSISQTWQVPSGIGKGNHLPHEKAAVLIRTSRPRAGGGGRETSTLSLPRDQIK